MAKKIVWHKIAEHRNELEWNSKQIATVEAGGKKICVGIFEDTLYAFASKCPHAGGSLQHAHWDDKGNIICPLHRYKFSVKTGINSSGEGYHLKTWDIKESEEGLFVGIEESSLFGLF